MDAQDNIKYTKEVLVVNAATKANDNYYRYHKGNKIHLPIDVVDEFESYGFKLIISKTFPDSRYYCATEIATGIPIGGSCAEIDGLKKMIDIELSNKASEYRNILINCELSPRYKSK